MLMYSQQCLHPMVARDQCTNNSTSFIALSNHNNKIKCLPLKRVICTKSQDVPW